MGKKGRSCLAVLNRVCILPSTEESMTTSKREKNTKERKSWGTLRKLKRTPSSIEEILQEAEIERRRTAGFIINDTKEEKCEVASAPVIPPSSGPHDHDHQIMETVQEEQRLSHQSCCANEEEQKRETKPGPPPPPPLPVTAVQEDPTPDPRPPTYGRADPLEQNAAAIRIQTVFRGHLVRRRQHRLKGMMRLEGLMKSQHVHRQMASTMKRLQQLVRIQSATRMQQMNNTATTPNPLKLHSVRKNEKELESEDSNQQEDWDDSILTKEEIDTRLQRKVEAAILRDRVLAYSRSHKVGDHMPSSAQVRLAGLKSAELPWTWSWNGGHSGLPPTPQHQPQSFSGENKFSTIFEPSVMDVFTPRSSRSPLGTKKRGSPRPSASVGGSPCHRANTPLRDNESLTSCPPLPNYMSPTISAMAKVYGWSNAQRLDSSKRRLNFDSAKSPISTISWSHVHTNFGIHEPNSHNLFRHPRDLGSPETMSINSAISLPAGVARKPFR